jgi:hypothetical protein
MNRDLMHEETSGPVTYRLYIDLEDSEVRGNAMASGDTAFDKQVEDEILKRLEDDSDIWAWAFVTVEACIGEFRGVESLGCCSYRDTAEFIADGYYRDMKSQAFGELKAMLERACKSLAEVTANV